MTNGELERSANPWGQVRGKPATLSRFRKDSVAGQGESKGHVRVDALGAPESGRQEALEVFKHLGNQTEPLRSESELHSSAFGDWAARVTSDITARSHQSSQQRNLVIPTVASFKQDNDCQSYSGAFEDCAPWGSLVVRAPAKDAALVKAKQDQLRVEGKVNAKQLVVSEAFVVTELLHVLAGAALGVAFERHRSGRTNVHNLPVIIGYSYLYRIAHLSKASLAGVVEDLLVDANSVWLSGAFLEHLSTCEVMRSNEVCGLPESFAALLRREEGWNTTQRHVPSVVLAFVSWCHQVVSQWSHYMAKLLQFHQTHTQMDIAASTGDAAQSALRLWTMLRKESEDLEESAFPLKDLEVGSPLTLLRLRILVKPGLALMTDVCKAAEEVMAVVGSAPRVKTSEDYGTDFAVASVLQLAYGAMCEAAGQRQDGRRAVWARLLTATIKSTQFDIDNTLHLASKREENMLKSTLAVADLSSSATDVESRAFVINSFRDLINLRRVHYLLAFMDSNAAIPIIPWKKIPKSSQIFFIDTHWYPVLQFGLEKMRPLSHRQKILVLFDAIDIEFGLEKNQIQNVIRSVEFINSDNNLPITVTRLERLHREENFVAKVRRELSSTASQRQCPGLIHQATQALSIGSSFLLQRFADHIKTVANWDLIIAAVHEVSFLRHPTHLQGPLAYLFKADKHPMLALEPQKLQNLYDAAVASRASPSASAELPYESWLRLAPRVNTVTKASNLLAFRNLRIDWSVDVGIRVGAFLQPDVMEVYSALFAQLLEFSRADWKLQGAFGRLARLRRRAAALAAHQMYAALGAAVGVFVSAAAKTVFISHQLVNVYRRYARWTVDSWTEALRQSPFDAEGTLKAAVEDVVAPLLLCRHESSVHQALFAFTARPTPGEVPRQLVETAAQPYFAFPGPQALAESVGSTILVWSAAGVRTSARVKELSRMLSGTLSGVGAELTTVAIADATREIRDIATTLQVSRRILALRAESYRASGAPGTLWKTLQSSFFAQLRPPQ